MQSASAEWAERRFSSAVMPLNPTHDDVVTSLEAGANASFVRMADREAKKREPWLAGLAQILSTPGRSVTTADVQKHLRSHAGWTVKRSQTRLIPDVLAPITSFTNTAKADGFDVRFATPFKVEGLRVTMGVAENIFESGPLNKPSEKVLAQPYFSIEPAIFARLQERAPEIIGGLERLATYASHDILHFVFDGQWNTDTDSAHDTQIDVGMEGNAFTPNVYESFLFAMMRRTFDEACRLYPKLGDVVMRDAEALVDAIERYRGQRRSETPASEHDAVDRECNYLLALGLSKNLMFVVNPGPTPGKDAPAAEMPRELRMRAIFERFPFLWKNTGLQQRAHAPTLRWKEGPLKGELVDIIELARTKYGASSYNRYHPSPSLARDLLGLPKSAVRKTVKARAIAGDADAARALSKYHDTYNNKSRAYRWQQRAARAGNADAIKAILGQRSPLKDPAQRQLIEQIALAGNPKAAMKLAKAYEEGDDVAADPATHLRWLEVAATNGSAQAQGALALHLEASGRPGDQARAAELLKSAAAGGDYEAKHISGMREHTEKARAGDAESLRWIIANVRTYDERDKQHLASLAHIDDPDLLSRRAYAARSSKDLDGAHALFLRAFRGNRANRDALEILGRLASEGVAWTGTDDELGQARTAYAESLARRRTPTTEALANMRQAIERNDLDAAFKIADDQMFDFQNEHLPVLVARKHPDSMWRLARNIYTGLSCTADRQAGLLMYEEAANAGSDKACESLFDHYRAKGDFAQAEAWLRRGASLGNNAMRTRWRRRERKEPS